MKYINVIESFYPSLSASEKKVADYILREKGKIMYSTLLELSNQIEVGETTILRFCQKIGLSGFQELKIEIAKYDNEQTVADYETYVDQIASNMHRTIDDTKSLLDMNALNASIDLIMKAKNLYIFGVGASGIICKEIESRFLRLGRSCNAIVDSHFQLMYASICSEKDVFIALSLSGATLDVIDSINLAKERQAKVIVITNYVLSPLALLADCLLLTAGKENPLDGGSTIAKVSQMYVSDLLVTGYALRNAKSAKRNKEFTAQAVMIRAK